MIRKSNKASRKESAQSNQKDEPMEKTKLHSSEVIGFFLRSLQKPR